MSIDSHFTMNLKHLPENNMINNSSELIKEDIHEDAGSNASSVDVKLNSNVNSKLMNLTTFESKDVLHPEGNALK
jgi:hypothetical protein